MGTASLPSIWMIVFSLFGLTLLITALGFRNPVYFVSIGYAFSIFAMALVTIILFRQQITVLSLLQNLLLIIWGLRLGIFLIWRDFQPSIRQQAGETADQYGGIGLSRKFVIWLGVSFLYGLMFLPGFVSAANPQPGISSLAVIVQASGVLLMAGGLVIEALADWQKSAFKTRFPKAFCNVGLYRRVRCPNYFGEILFWLGNWVMGIAFYSIPLVWIGSLIGLVCIVLIMFGSTRRLERAQDQRYGDLPEYQQYIQSVPVLFPYVPVYTLKKIRVYLE
jgi:steroid 5-alpha reductase family enzyme